MVPQYMLNIPRLVIVDQHIVIIGILHPVDVDLGGLIDMGDAMVKGSLSPNDHHGKNQHCIVLCSIQATEDLAVRGINE